MKKKTKMKKTKTKIRQKSVYYNWCQSMGWVRTLVNKENVQMTYETHRLSRSKFKDATFSRRSVNMSSRNQSNSKSDGESATTDQSPPRRFNRRAFSRVFVHLEKRLKAAPGKIAFFKIDERREGKRNRFH